MTVAEVMAISGSAFAVLLSVIGFFLGRLVRKVDILSLRIHRLNNFAQTAALSLKITAPELYE